MEKSVRAELYSSRKMETRSYFDFTLLFLVVFISFVGLIIIYSSSAYIAQSKNLPSTHFLKKQVMALGIGFLVMLIFSKMRYAYYRKKFFGIKLSNVALIVAYALQIYVTFVLKENINGSKRWINLPLLGNFQPAEFAKLAIILYTADACYRMTKRINKVSGFLATFVRVLPLMMIIGLQDLSSAAITLLIFMAICFVASKKYNYFFALFGIFVTGVAWMVLKGGGYRSERIMIWQNVETHEKGQQILQGLYAIASGGLFGTGLGGSAQKFGRVPEAYNDMVLTIICEELGVVGAIAILTIFIFILIRMFTIALNAPDLFGMLITVGVFCQIAVQVLLNVAVVTNSVPSTGITLPFISYGGSSVVLLLLEIGIVLNVSSNIKYKTSA